MFVVLIHATGGLAKFYAHTQTMAFATGDLSAPFTTDNLLLPAQPEIETTTENQIIHLIQAVALLRFLYSFSLDFVRVACVEFVVNTLFQFRRGLMKILSAEFRHFHRSPARENLPAAHPTQAGSIRISGSATSASAGSSGSGIFIVEANPGSGNFAKRKL